MCDDAEKRMKLYGIGIGPGDPGLITVEGLRLLREAPVIFVPAGDKVSGSRADEILTAAGVDGKSFHQLVFPMVKDTLTLEEKWRTSAEEVYPVLQKKGWGCFVTLGDPSVYSTWIYLRRALSEIGSETGTEANTGMEEGEISEKRGTEEGQRMGTEEDQGPTKTGVECRVIPGIQTMNAVAAALGVPLVEGRERLALLPTPDDPKELKAFLPLFDTLVLYKIGDRLEKLLAFLESEGLGERAYFARKLGLPEEILAAGTEAIPPGTEGYLSAMIIKSGDTQLESTYYGG